MNQLELIRSYGDRVLVIDTETTGLDASKDEILSLSIVNMHGTVLFDRLIKPKARKRWPKAQEIHGITPADVKEEKTIDEYSSDLSGFFNGSYLIAGYNVGFDVKMLEASGIDLSKCKTFDVMREYERYSGKRVKLSECATCLGYGVFDAHGSLEDAKATAYCLSRIIDDKSYEKVCTLEDRGMSKENAKVIASQQSSSGCVIPMVVITFVLIVFCIILAVT